MKLLVAALLPTSGSILVDGQPLAKGERQLKARLGYLPQDFGLFDELTVTQFLDYMAALKGLREAKAAIRACHSGRQPGGEGKGQNPHPVRRPAPAGGHRPGPAGGPRLSDL